MRQNDTLNSLRQSNAMIFFLYVLNFAPFFKFLLYIKIQNIKAKFVLKY